MNEIYTAEVEEWSDAALTNHADSAGIFILFFFSFLNFYYMFIKKVLPVP